MLTQMDYWSYYKSVIFREYYYVEHIIKAAINHLFIITMEYMTTELGQFYLIGCFPGTTFARVAVTQKVEWLSTNCGVSCLIHTV